MADMSILRQEPEPENPYAPPSALELEPTPAPEPELALQPIGFGHRAAARVIDTVVHFFLGGVAGSTVNFVAGFLVGSGLVAAERIDALRPPATWIAFLVGMTGSMLYQVILEGWHGSSLGKLLLGLVVLQEDGRPCTPVQAGKRALAYFVDALFFGLIAASCMSDSPLKQRLGDQWADTVVASRKSAPSRSLRSGLSFLALGFIAIAADLAVLALPGLFLVFAA